MSSLCPHCKLPLSKKESARKTCPVCHGNLDGTGSPPSKQFKTTPALIPPGNQAPTATVETVQTPPIATPPTGSPWFVPLPLERLAVARGAAVIGLIAGIPLFLFFGGVILLIPLFKGPVDIGGIACLGPASGLLLALVVHFFAARRGYRLSILGWLAIPALFFGTVFLINRFAPDPKWRALKQHISGGQAGLPEFAPDPAFKAAFVKVLDELQKDRKTGSIYFRCVESHNTKLTPKARTELVLWKLDPSFRQFAGQKEEIPGSMLQCSDVSAGYIRHRFEKELRPIIPEDRLKFEMLSASDPTAGKFVFDFTATTQHDETFSKLRTSFHPRLQPNFHVDWTFRLLDRAGKEMYSRTATTKPAEKMSFSDIPLGAESTTTTRLMQLSAHDNFARELLGRLGLAPGQVKTEWSNRN